jgi:hypothetical protein
MLTELNTNSNDDILKPFLHNKLDNMAKLESSSNQMIKMNQNFPYLNKKNFSSLSKDQNMCLKLNIVSLYCILLFVFVFIVNSLLLIVFYRNKKLRSPLNMFIIAITILNLFGAVLELPIVIVSNYFCEWVFYDLGCVISGFLMYFIGCTSIFLNCAISFERFFILYEPTGIRKLNKRFCSIMILGCFALGLFWSSMPLLGWSHYSYEGVGTSCSVEWNERSQSVTSYNVSMFLLVFILPVSFISISNLRIIFIVSVFFLTNIF